jgi:hypothetical protein
MLKKSNRASVGIIFKNQIFPLNSTLKYFFRDGTRGALRCIAIWVVQGFGGEPMVLEVLWGLASGVMVAETRRKNTTHALA